MIERNYVPYLSVNQRDKLVSFPDTLDEEKKMVVGGAGQIIMVSGLPGSGKSVVAKKLRGLLTDKNVSGSLFRTDNFRAPALQGVPKDQWYTPKNNQKTYNYMFGEAMQKAEEGPVILDATFAKRELRHLLYDCVPENMKLYRIHVISPDLLAQEWMELRQVENTDPSEADYNVRREIAVCFDPFQSHFIVINNNSTLEALEAQVEKTVRL